MFKKIKKLISDLLFVIPREFRVSIILCLPFSILIAIFEFLSIGAIIPFIQSLLQKDILFNNSFVLELLKFSGNQYIVFFSILIVSFFLIKGILSIIFINYILSIKKKLHFSITNNLLLSYLKKNYNFFLNNNTSKLLSNLDYETSLFCDRFFISLINFIKEFLIIFIIMTLIFVIQPIASLVCFTLFFIFTFFFVKYNKKRINFYAKTRQELQHSKLKNFQEIFGSIREIKVFNLETYFLNKSNTQVKFFLKTVKNYAFLLELPKHLFEFLGVFIIFVFIFVSFQVNQNIEIIAIEVGVLVAASFRLIPLVSKIIYLNSEIKFTYPALQVLKNELLNMNSLEKNSINSLDKNKIKLNKKIELKNIKFSYDNNQIIFDQLNLVINQADKIFINGDSGVGKSTLAEIICGIIDPSTGSIIVDGKILDQSKELLNCSYLPQKSFLLDDTIKKNIALGLKDDEIDQARIDILLDIVDLKKFVASLKFGIDTKVGELGNNLSGGQRQRISLARALYFDPSILILDEATNALDEKSEALVLNNLSNFFKNTTMIIISHNMNVLKICDKVIEISNGKIYLKKDN
ncbi:ABC transporter ATP-binding protein/permease [Pelagibacteraceae bacterium]|nr:ABC transporter ATP-binding protein/permease [Pelagibacteraceae bacterium]